MADAAPTAPGAPPGGQATENVFEYVPDALDGDASPSAPGGAPAPSRGGAGAGARSGKEPAAPQRRRVEYETLGAASGRGFEPPEQRLARLAQEVGDLIRVADGGGAQTSADGRAGRHGGADERTEPFGQGLPAASVAAELRVLEQRLGALARDGLLGEQEASQVAPLSASAGTLTAQLERLAVGGTAAFAGAGEGRVTYELNYAPTCVGAAAGDQAQVASLEAAVAEIEQQLGVFDQGCPFADLQAAVMQAERRVAGLDAQRLEAVRSGISKAAKDVELVMKKKEELEGMESDPQLDEKTNELFEFCHRWDAVAPSMPTVISRLQSLQALHQESHSFAARLSALEGQQEELATLLESTGSAVDGLGKAMQENMAVIRDKMCAFEAKITAAMPQ